MTVKWFLTYYVIPVTVSIFIQQEFCQPVKEMQVLCLIRHANQTTILSLWAGLTTVVIYGYIV